MSLKATLCLDDVQAPEVQPLHPVTALVDRPFIFVEVGGLSLWGHESNALRSLAAALTTAADALEAAAPHPILEAVAFARAHGLIDEVSS